MRCTYCGEEFNPAYLTKVYNYKVPDLLKAGGEVPPTKYRCISCTMLFRDCSLRKSYGISLKKYETMLTHQRGVCAICGISYAHKSGDVLQPLVVDHNHTSGKVRGLLCSRCNTTLGRFECGYPVNSERVEGFLLYLRVYDGEGVQSEQSKASGECA